MKHRARKRFGQNFLHQATIIERIVESIHPQPGQNLVEIGPGQGALTYSVLKQAKFLTAIELDRDLIGQLKIHSQAYGDLDIIESDVLKVDFANLGQELRIFGNLPYNISTPLLLHLFKVCDSIQDMCFMLQKEVVLRMSADCGTKAYGRLSVMAQYFCEVEYLFTVPPEAFTPAPKVDSAIVRLIPHKQRQQVADIKLFEQVVAKAFAMKRKTIANNLKGIVDRQALLELGIDPSQRAETITVEKFVQLTDYIADNVDGE